MKKGFIINNGFVKFSWVWATDYNCPFPECLKFEDGDEIIIDDETPYESYMEFHQNLNR